MSNLPAYVKQVQQVYSAIARKIEELIVSLNEADQHDDEHIQELCRNINTFLERLERSVKGEWKSAGRALKDQTKARFLNSLQRELQKIKELKTYVALAGRKPRPDIIRKIHALYREVDDEIKEQEALAA